MDVHTKERRSYNMSQIKNRDTSTELKLRRYLWGRGIRGYRVNAKIKGKPDMYFHRKKVAVFIDGCFWHHCPKCFIKPKSNISFWSKKISENIERDKNINKLLHSSGIKVIRIWEHESDKKPAGVFIKLQKVLA